MAKWRNAIDLSLLQMATGLRQTEGRRLDWPLVQVDSQGVMSIAIPEHVAKARADRIIHVLEPRVADRILERCERAGGEGYVIGTPSDPTKIWHRSSCVAAVAELYKKAAYELGVDVLLTERSHVWRTTLRTFYDGQARPRYSTPSSATPKKWPTSTTPTTASSTTSPWLPTSAPHENRKPASAPTSTSLVTSRGLPHRA
jgi:hypothetical protein